MQILKPVEMLRGELVKEKGEVEGAAAWEKLQRSVRNAALQAFYSLKDRYADRGYDTRSQPASFFSTPRSPCLSIRSGCLSRHEGVLGGDGGLASVGKD